MHTDHQNLTYNTIKSQRVLRWRLFLREYQPQFHYIKGTDNTIDNAFSRLPRWSGQRSTGPNPNELPSNQKSSSDDENTNFSIPCNDDDMLECFLNHPAVSKEHPAICSNLPNYCRSKNHYAALIQILASKPNSFGRFLMNQGANLFVISQV